MMKIATVAALSFVAAADVPVFSSNDDYDEINLNIRLLSVNNGTANASTHFVSGDMSSTYSTADTAKNLCSSVNGPTCTALGSSLSSGSCEISTCGAASRRARALQASDVAITQAYKLGFASEAAASTASSTIAGAGFAASFQSELNSALSAAGLSLTATVSSFSAPVVADTTGTPVAPAPAPGAAAPSPSPSPSSDASMIKATTAIAAAVFASLF
jgi:hypothetical protein